MSLDGLPKMPTECLNPECSCIFLAEDYDDVCCSQRCYTMYALAEESEEDDAE